MAIRDNLGASLSKNLIGEPLLTFSGRAGLSYCAIDVSDMDTILFQQIYGDGNGSLYKSAGFHFIGYSSWDDAIAVKELPDFGSITVGDTKFACIQNGGTEITEINEIYPTYTQIDVSNYTAIKIIVYYVSGFGIGIVSTSCKHKYFKKIFMGNLYEMCYKIIKDNQILKYRVKGITNSIYEDESVDSECYCTIDQRVDNIVSQEKDYMENRIGYTDNTGTIDKGAVEKTIRNLDLSKGRFIWCGVQDSTAASSSAFPSASVKVLIESN